jgi:uncharacterized protein
VVSKAKGSACHVPGTFAARLACSLPFATFMGSAMLMSTFTEFPDLWYVLKLIPMSATLVMFLPLYRKIKWRVDTLALVVGGAIGVLWIFAAAQTNDAGALDKALGSIPTALLTGWIMTRVFGTVFVVPIVEELFFRGYLLNRIVSYDRRFSVLGLCVSSALFSVLHGRWFLAAIAALAFGLLYLRSRMISDAIVAHATSNAIIAVYAVAIQNWAII